MHVFQHTAMATLFEVRCTHPDAQHARQAARCGFEAVDRLEQQLSRFVEASDISRINHLSPGETTTVCYETMQCLLLARMMHLETRGAFDIARGTGFDRLVLEPDTFAVSVTATGVQLDLGAIGKGYAVDRLADVLEDWGVDQALIDAGRSSVLALEPPAGANGWPLTLSDPSAAGSVLVQLSVRQYVLGASGIRKGDHIWDGRLQAPARTRRAAWAAGPRGVLADLGRRGGVEASATAVADALSTAWMISPAGEIQAVCQRFAGLEARLLEGNLLHYLATGGGNSP